MQNFFRQLSKNAAFDSWNLMTNQFGFLLTTISSTQEALALGGFTGGFCAMKLGNLTLCEGQWQLLCSETWEFNSLRRRMA